MKKLQPNFIETNYRQIIFKKPILKNRFSFISNQIEKVKSFIELGLILFFTLGFSIQDNLATELTNFDLAFEEGTGSGTSCPSRLVNVKMINTDNLTNWKVSIAKIYIDYTGSGAQIDQAKTTNSLNLKLAQHYYGPLNINGTHDPIISYSSGRIKIDAEAKSESDKQLFTDLLNLISIYFEGEPSMNVTFTFDYVIPERCHLLMNYNSSVDICYPKGGSNQIPPAYEVTKQFLFGALQQNYDLSFDPIDECTSPNVSVKIVNMSDPNLLVDKLKIYINYTTTGTVSIDEENTRYSLNSALNFLYVKFQSNTDIITFSPGLIAIEADFNESLSGNSPKSLSELSQLLTIYFNGLPNSAIQFSFSYSQPETILYLKDNFTCIFSKPYGEYTQNYDIVRNFNLISFQESFNVSYSSVTDSEMFCDLKSTNVKLHSDQQIDDFGIKHLRLKLLVTGAITIDEEKTKNSLASIVSQNYKGFYPNSGIVRFENTNIIIDCVLREESSEQTFSKLEDEILLTIYFSGNQGSQVNFSTSADFNHTFIIFNNGANCERFISLNNQQENYQMPQNVFSGGTIYTLSNYQKMGHCNVEAVSAMRDVDINFYNLEYNPYFIFGTTTSDIDGLFKTSYQANQCLKRVKPDKLICNDCGLDISDIYLIRKVILGVLPTFQFAYQPFVSDINNDGYISTLDLILLNNILLTMGAFTPYGYTDFRFIPKNDFEAFQSTNNYGLGVPSYNQYKDFTSYNEDLSFYAFKTGDVDKVYVRCDHCSPNCGGERETERFAKNNIFIDKIAVIDNNFNITTACTDKDQFDIIGMHLQVEPLGIELDTILFYDSDEAMSGYYYDKISGSLSIIWTNKNSYKNKISESNRLFTFVFKKGLFSKEDMKIKIQEDLNLNLSVRMDGMIFESSFGESLITRNDDSEFKIIPTLINDQLTIEFISKIDEKTNFSIFDTQGRLIYFKSFDVIKGLNILKIDDLVNLSNGVFLYNFKNSDEEYKGKLIKQ